jgi:hypothetical protein
VKRREVSSVGALVKLVVRTAGVNARDCAAKYRAPREFQRVT